MLPIRFGDVLVTKLVTKSLSNFVCCRAREVAPADDAKAMKEALDWTAIQSAFEAGQRIASLAGRYDGIL